MVDIYSVSEYSIVDQSIVPCIPNSSLLPRELSLSACQPVVVVTHTLQILMVTFVGVEESFLNISFPLFLLAFASIFVGFLVKEMVLSNTIYPMVPSFIKIAPFILSLLGMLLVFIVYSCGMEFR